MNLAFLFSNSNCVFISILFIVLIVIVSTFFKNTKESFPPVSPDMLYSQVKDGMLEGCYESGASLIGDGVSLNTGAPDYYSNNYVRGLATSAVGPALQSQVSSYLDNAKIGELVDAAGVHNQSMCEYKGCIEPGYVNTIESPPDNLDSDQALCGDKVEVSNNCLDGQQEYNGKCYQHHTTITAEGGNCSYLSDRGSNLKKCNPDERGAGRYYENNEGTKIFCEIVDDNCVSVVGDKAHEVEGARCIDVGTCQEVIGSGGASESCPEKCYGCDKTPPKNNCSQVGEARCTEGRYVCNEGKVIDGQCPEADRVGCTWDGTNCVPSNDCEGVATGESQCHALLNDTECAQCPGARSEVTGLYNDDRGQGCGRLGEDRCTERYIKSSNGEEYIQCKWVSGACETDDENPCGGIQPPDTVDDDVSPTSYCVEDQATTPVAGKQLDTSDANYKTISQLANTEYVHDQTLCSYIDDPSIVSPTSYCVEDQATTPVAGKQLDTSDANYKTISQLANTEYVHDPTLCSYIDDTSIIFQTNQINNAIYYLNTAEMKTDLDFAIAEGENLRNRLEAEGSTETAKLSELQNAITMAQVKIQNLATAATAQNEANEINQINNAIYYLNTAEMKTDLDVAIAEGENLRNRLEAGGSTQTAKLSELQNAITMAQVKIQNLATAATAQNEANEINQINNAIINLNKAEMKTDLDVAIAEGENLHNRLEAGGSTQTAKLSELQNAITMAQVKIQNLATAQNEANEINQINNAIIYLNKAETKTDLDVAITEGENLHNRLEAGGSTQTAKLSELQESINDAILRGRILESIENSKPNDNTTLTQNIIDGSNLGVKTSILTDAADRAIENLVKKYSVGMMGAMIEETSVGSDAAWPEPVNNCLTECNMLDNLGVWDHVSDKHNIPQSKTGFGTLDYCDYKCQNMKKYCCEGSLGCEGGDNSNIYVSDQKICYKKTGSTHNNNGCKQINNNNCEFEYPFDVNKNKTYTDRFFKNHNTVGAYAYAYEYDNYPIDDDFEEYEEEPRKAKEYCMPLNTVGQNKCINDVEMVVKQQQ